MHTSFKVKDQRSRSPGRHNVKTGSASYLPNREAYELQTQYTAGGRRPASATSAVTSKVNGQGRNVTWCIWQLLADKSRTKRPRFTKIGRMVVCPTGDIAHQFQGQVKGQRPRSSGRHNVETWSALCLPNVKANRLWAPIPKGGILGTMLFWMPSVCSVFPFFCHPPSGAFVTS